MKNYLKFLLLVITLNIVFALFPKAIVAQQNDVNFQVFYDKLSPYGQWVDDANYGYVWIPATDQNFTPYSTNGYWLLTDSGWMWVSGYEWGWAPFHYGRWDNNSEYGWYWVPDHEWGPSWVTWRSSSDYYGWAPMRPGVTIQASFGGNYNEPHDNWIFVRSRYMGRHDIDNRYIDHRNNVNIINNSIVINNTRYDESRHTTYVVGPKREEVQKFTGKTINPISIQERHDPGQIVRKGQVQIYRPQVQKNDPAHKSVPAKFVNRNDFKRPTGNNAGKQPQVAPPVEKAAGKDEKPVRNVPVKTDTKTTPSRRQPVPAVIQANKATRVVPKANVPPVNNRNVVKQQPKPTPANSPNSRAVAKPSPKVNVPPVNNRNIVKQQPKPTPVASPDRRVVAKPSPKAQNVSPQRNSNNAAHPAKVQPPAQPKKATPPQNKNKERQAPARPEPDNKRER
jgi:hypothetical protein